MFMDYREEMYPMIYTWNISNRICKEAIHGLEVNKTDRAISRVAKSFGTLSPVLDQYDLVNNVPDTSSIHKAPISDKDREMIIKELAFTIGYFH